MSATHSTTDTINLDIYSETQRKLRRLERYFPQEFIVNLASDVLQNLTKRARHVKDAVDHPSKEQIEALCQALISDDETAGAEFILGVRNEGASPETVYLKYLAEAARVLGDWWDEDQVSFATVTLGSSRIYAIMSAMRHLFAPRARPQVRSAVFASVPDEKHVLGIRMAADVFRSNGWNIDLKVGHTHDELIESIDWQSTCLIGLSFGGQHSIKPLSRLLVAFRIHSPAVDTVVCGQDVSDIQHLLGMAGAIGSSEDVHEALDKMNALWDGASSPQA